MGTGDPLWWEARVGAETVTFDTASTSMRSKVRTPSRAIRAGRAFACFDRPFHWLALSAAMSLLGLLIAIGIALVWRSELSLRTFGLRFLVQSVWDPVRHQFSALTSLYGTIVSSVIGLALAVPLSLAIGFYLAELAPPPLASFFGTAVELLGAIPSIIYGMWGLFVLAPIMADQIQPAIQSVLGSLPLFQGPPMGIGLFTAGVILALMVIPFVSSVAREIFTMVPAVMKESGYGIGATKWEVVRGVTLRYGLSGIVGACLLGLARALGETMAVTFVIGNRHAISLSLFEPGNSISSTLANEFTEASEPLYLSSLIELGLVLFVLTLAIQTISQLWLRRVERSMGGVR